MDLATFITEAIQRHKLSFRGLERRADDLSHAYIWRLAKGEKASPSSATVEKLGGALELTPRERQIFELLVKTPVDDSLYRLMLARDDIEWSDFEAAASARFRGTRPTTEDGWLNTIQVLQQLHDF